MSLFEIRHYEVFPGKMDAWVTFMETKVVPFFAARGMIVTAMFRDADGGDQFTYIRRFDDEAHRAALYAAVYESDDWQTNYKPTVRQLVDVDKTIVYRAVGTPCSTMR